MLSMYNIKKVAILVWPQTVCKLNHCLVHADRNKIYKKRCLYLINLREEGMCYSDGVLTVNICSGRR